MNYSSVALISLGIFIIINYDVLIKKRYDFYNFVPAIKEYRIFLVSVMVFFISDALWGILEAKKLAVPLYIDTMVFFAEMALAIFLWRNCIISYLNEKNVFMKVVNYLGWFFLIFEWIVVVINIFTPILFDIDETGKYTAGKARYITLYIQIGMFLVTTAYMTYIIITHKSQRKTRYITLGAFGLVMAVFIFVQVFFPFLPFYTIGYILGTCLLHTFVLEDLKKDQADKLQELLDNESKQKLELIEAKRIAYTDALTGVRNKHAFVEAEAEIEEKIAKRTLKDFGVIVFDLNGLKYVNDHFGHDCGDRYLQDSCNMICTTFKHSAVFRIGGDEFVALVKGMDYKNIENLLTAFNHEIEENVRKGQAKEITEPVIIATGYSEYDPVIDNSFNSIFIRADKKMYARKNDLKQMGSR